MVKAVIKKPLKKFSKERITDKLFQGIFSTNPFDEQISPKNLMEKLEKKAAAEINKLITFHCREHSNKVISY